MYPLTVSQTLVGTELGPNSKRLLKVCAFEPDKKHMSAQKIALMCLILLFLMLDFKFAFAL